MVDSIRDWVQEEERLRLEAARTPTPPPPVLEQPTIPLKVGSRYGLMTRAEEAAIKAEEEEKNKKGKGRKSARSKSPRRSARSRDKDESPEKKDKGESRDLPHLGPVLDSYSGCYPGFEQRLFIRWIPIQRIAVLSGG